jgi:prevent-host-death family protein
VKVVSKSASKAKMLEYFRQVETTGEALLVTSNGQPVLQVIPYRGELSVDEVFADVRGKIRYHGDLLEPTTAEWETS